MQLQTFQLIATVTAVLTVIRFQRRLKDYMVGRNALPKLLAFKIFVVLTTLQHVSPEHPLLPPSRFPMARY